MNSNDDQKFRGHVSPVGWYVGSYLLRFVELNDPERDHPDTGFLVWENTVIVRAADLEEAFRKVEAVANEHTLPYKGGPDGVPVQWIFEGISDLLPIYEPLEDGAEIMWTEHDSITLSKLRSRAMSMEQVKERFRHKSD